VRQQSRDREKKSGASATAARCQSQRRVKAAVHAARRLLDFSNAFNCVRRDVILDAVAAKTPYICCLVNAAYACDLILVYGQHRHRSREGARQGDPLGSLEFCKAIHPLLIDLHSEVKIGFKDDVTSAADIKTLDTDVDTIISRSAETGLSLNIKKCEIITDDPAAIFDTSVMGHFMKVSKQDMTLYLHLFSRTISRRCLTTQN